MSNDKTPDLDLDQDAKNQAASDTEAKWEEPVLPPDDFADSGDAEEPEDEIGDGEEGSGKGKKSSLAIFALLGIVALGGAGFAYKYFGAAAPVTAEAPPVMAVADAGTAPVEANPSPAPAITQSPAPQETTAPVIADPVMASKSSPELSPENPAPVAPSPEAVPQLPVAETAPSLPTISAPDLGAAAKSAAVEATPVEPVKPIVPDTTVTAALPSVTEPAIAPALPTPALPVEPALPQETSSPATATPVAPKPGAKEPVVPPGMTAVPPVAAETAPVAAVAPQPEPVVPVSQPVTPAPSIIAVAPTTVAPVVVDNAVPKSIKSDHAKTVKTKPVINTKPATVKTTQKMPSKSAAKPVASAKAPAYVIRSAMPGAAWIADPANPSELKEIKVGDKVAGIGRVKAVELKAGSWQVVGSLHTLR